MKAKDRKGISINNIFDSIPTQISCLDISKQLQSTQNSLSSEMIGHCGLGKDLN